MESTLIDVFAWEMFSKDLLLDIFLLNGRALLLLFGCFLLLNCVENSAANRHFIFSIGLLSTLLLPISSQLIPAYDFIVEVTRPVTFSEMPAAVEAVVHGTTINPNELSLIFSALFISYCLVTLVILLKVLLSNMSIWLQTRHCSVVEEPCWTQALAVHIKDLNIRGTVVIKHAPSIYSPMTWGVFRPVILLPSHALYWPDELITSTLLHELAHIKRRDWLVQQVARCVCAVYWINPLCWIAFKRLSFYAEMATDDLVLNSGVERTRYASALVNVAERLSHTQTHSASALAMAMSHQPKQLRKRVTAVLDTTELHLPLTKEQLINAGFFIALILLPFTSLRANYVEKITFTMAFPNEDKSKFSVNSTPTNQQILGKALPEFNYLSPAEIRHMVFNETGWRPSVNNASSETALTENTVVKTEYHPIQLTELVERTKDKFEGVFSEANSVDDSQASSRIEINLPIQASDYLPESKNTLSSSDVANSHSQSRPKKIVEQHIIKKMILPKYPRRAVKRGIEGEVIVEYSLNHHGEVTDAQIITANPSGVFDKQVLKAIKQSEFTPKKENGIAVASEGLREKYVFVLES